MPAMILYGVALVGAVAYWLVGGLIVYHEGLARVTGTALYGPGSTTYAPALWAAAIAVAATVVVRFARRGRRERPPARRAAITGLVGGLLCAAFLAATPWLLEFAGAAIIHQRVAHSSLPAERLAGARDLGLARTRLAKPFLRRLVDSGDPHVSLEAAYGLALLSGGPRDAKLGEALCDAGDFVYDGEDLLAARIDDVLLSQLWAITRGEWPARGALPRPGWTSPEEFRREWPEARKRYAPAVPLLVEKLESLGGGRSAAVAELVRRIVSGPESAAAERELLELPSGETAAEVAASLRVAGPEARARLVPVARRVWSGRERE